MAFVRCPSSFTPVESEPRSRSPLPGFHAWSFRPFPNLAKPEAYDVSCRERRKVEMLFAHLKRILRLDRLRLRGPSGAKDEFLLAATALHIVLFENCLAFTRVAARTLAPSPICDQLHRRLQPFRYLHDCSGCFRLERLPGGACTHWKAR